MLVHNIGQEKFLDEAMKLDPNIRLVAIYDGQFKAKFREGMKRYFEDEEIKSSLNEAQNRWASRKKMSYKIGNPKKTIGNWVKHRQNY